ncbi:glycosylated lysosomal membrane protein [Genypterus blacodes]|uniref:glycosylated lysosomal membrane protein n=1 Tax=Genypterus blacodes TaxID=154954 RepID=UPI003F76C258
MAATETLKSCSTFSLIPYFSLMFLFSTFGFPSSGAEKHQRKLSFQLNPGLNTSVPHHDVGLLHVRALGHNDTLHFLFCNLGAPTLLLVHTDTNASVLQVDWDHFLNRNVSGSLRVEPESSVVSSSGLVFSRLWEFDDVNDTAVPERLFPPVELQSLVWSAVNLTGESALLCGSDDSPSFINGSLCLQFSAFDAMGRGQAWPRLLHNADSSQLRVWLEGVLPRATRSRFSLELQAVGGAYPLDKVNVLRSIDDEFMPSIFQVSQWLSSSDSSGDSVFVQWKPVAFRRSSPTLEDATPCRHSAPTLLNGSAAASASGLIQAFYGARRETFGLNMTFGMAGEPFYNATRFLSWTLLVGVGSPPLDSFSPLVLAIMAVGLGTPMILLLLGGVCVCVRKMTAPPSSAYEPIN